MPPALAARRGLPGWAVAAALLLHLALLVTGAQALGEWRREHLLPRPTSTPTALKVRSVVAQAAGAPSPEPTRPVLGALSGGAPVTPLQPSEVAPVIPADAVFEPAVYVPRALLTVGPVARAPVLLDWPANWLARGTYRGVLKLYLDEQGRVERVEADDDTALPGPLFDVARAAFMATTFSPGELNGQAVRTVMRVEVEFDGGGAGPAP